MTDLRDATVTSLPLSVRKPRVRALAVPLVAAVAVALLAAYFFQHFPATMLAFALVLLALGRLAPVVREVVSHRAANIFQACFDFAGVGLLALAATQGAAGEITRAISALLHG